MKKGFDKALQTGIMARAEAFQSRENALISAPQLCHGPEAPLLALKADTLFAPNRPCTNS